MDKDRGWVSVKAGLPDTFVSVLVYMPDDEPLPKVHEGYLTPKGDWMLGLYGHAVRTTEVTHWRNMPVFTAETEA